MTTEKRYSVGELAQLADTTVRTIRYYTEEGLLPQPETEGKYAYYSRTHLDRLLLIKRLKDAYLPLREIRRVMLSLSDEEVRRQLNEPIQTPQESLLSRNPSQPGAGALEYLQQMREGRTGLSMHARSIQADHSSGQRKHFSSAPDPGISSPQYNLPVGQAWNRYHLAEGVELSVRETLTPESASRVQQIVAYARRLYQTK